MAMNNNNRKEESKCVFCMLFTKMREDESRLLLERHDFQMDSRLSWTFGNRNTTSSYLSASQPASQPQKQRQYTVRYLRLIVDHLLGNRPFYLASDPVNDTMLRRRKASDEAYLVDGGKDVPADLQVTVRSVGRSVGQWICLFVFL